MVYHTVVILLARPYIQRPKPSSPPRAPVQQVDALTQKVVTIYLEAARSISSLGDQYRQVFGGFRKSPLVATYANLSAALALLDPLRQSRQYHGTREADDDRIKSCLQTLKELSVAWTPPARYHCSLMKIMRDRMGDRRKETKSESLIKQDISCLNLQEMEPNSTLSGNHDRSDQAVGNMDWPLWALEENADMQPVLEPHVGILAESDALWEHFTWNWPGMSLLGDCADS